MIKELDYYDKDINIDELRYDFYDEIIGIFDDCPHAGITHTPYKLCDEIIDKLPNLNDKHILVLFNPEFCFTILERYPCAKVTIVTGSKKIEDFVINDIGSVHYLSPYDASKLEVFQVMNKKFDVVIGNPPYQLPQAKHIKLWSRFLEKAILLSSEYVAFITPDCWLSGINKVSTDTRNSLKNYNIPCIITGIKEKYFKNIGETICAFIIDKNHYHKIKIYDNDLKILNTIDTFNGKEICLSDNEKIRVSLYNKIINSSSVHVEDKYIRVHANDKFIKDTENYSPLESKIFKYKVITKHNQCFYTKIKHKDHFGPKIIFNNSGYYWSKNNENYMQYKDINNVVASNNAFFIKFNSQYEANNAYSYFSSKVYRWFVGEFKTGGFNRMIVGKLPILDATRHWTDKELYKYFNLSQEEINYIEETIK